MRRLLVVVMLACSASCVGTTGGAIVDFPAAASGPPDAVAGQAMVFPSDFGWTVTLTKAVLHIGALYLDQSSPVSGSQNTNCILPGTYVAEVTTSLDVDLLSPAPQPFPPPTLAPAAGHGTTLPALIGEVWLVGADINTVEDKTPILQVAGTADGSGASIPFEGTITIGSNRQAAASSTGLATPVCKQRIVAPVPAPLTVQSTGGLVVRINPRRLFVNVDFGRLAKVGSTYAFSDDPTSSGYTQPSVNLYSNLRAATPALYDFEWSSSLGTTR